MVFPVVLSIQELDHRETWALKTWCFWTVVLEKTLGSPLDCKRSNQSILTKISSKYSLEGLMLEVETPILWPPDTKNWLIGKDPDVGKDWRQKEKGMTEDEMVEWHHRLDGHEFEQAPGVGDGQGGLMCCSSWSHKELGMTEPLNWTEFQHIFLLSQDPILLTAKRLEKASNFIPASQIPSRPHFSHKQLYPEITVYAVIKFGCMFLTATQK